MMVSCRATGLSGARFSFGFTDGALLTQLCGCYRTSLAEELFKIILRLNPNLKMNAKVDPGASAAAAVPQSITDEALGLSGETQIGQPSQYKSYTCEGCGSVGNKATGMQLFCEYCGRVIT